MVKSDWEGPWVTADHAYEVTKRGIPQGDKLFAGISAYDDYLAYVRKKDGYEPGDTLSLIAPFLIAYNIRETFLVDIARDNANFIEGFYESIRTLDELGYTLKIISTSYCQYVYYTTKIAGIPAQNVRCTNFPIEEYFKSVTEKDKKLVRLIARDIINFPKFEITSTTTTKDILPGVKEVIKKLDDFFWKELPETSYKRVLEETKPLGGNRKFAALKEILDEERKELHECETVGDSITDWVMLNETKNAGGLAISFNGNDYAVRNANIAIMSDNCMITPIIVDLFRRSGIEMTERITRNWSYSTLKEAAQNGFVKLSLFKRFMEFVHSSSASFPEVSWITKHDLETIIARSKKIRKEVRGTAVGTLG